MTTLQERMAEVFPHPTVRGLQAEIAKLCDVKPASVSAWFKNPEKVASISRTNAEKLCTHFKLKVSPAWLAEGLLPKFKSASAGEGETVPSGAPAVVTTAPSPAEPTLGQTLAQLGQELERASPQTRAAVADLLSRYAQNPAQGQSLAQAIEMLVRSDTDKKADV